ncbi:M48 family metalloprotease [Mariniblastus sp.]|nr:M48 family metalloprotease [Mariniblastus sp.]MDB4380699.1 M48 family metalloprotease [Mariniblastus sp.]MDC3224987.1 M48 family metalloprotease [Mariniblastus sp.]
MVSADLAFDSNFISYYFLTTMNLVIGAVIVLTLLGSELTGAEPVKHEQLWLTIFMVGVLAILVPGLAIFQTYFVSIQVPLNQIDNKQRDQVIARLSACHSAVWLSASLATVWAIRWQDVVRGTWQLDRWPLLDEFFILLPVVFSLFTSWIIFSNLSRQRSKTDSLYFSMKRKIGLTCIRFQSCLLFVIFPAATIILIRDLEPYLASFNAYEKSASFAVLFVTLATGLPLLLLTACSHTNFKDPILENQIKTIFTQNKISLRRMRIWRTGNQVANAAVVGLIPRYRMLILSDQLLNIFPRNEVLAIARHEAGHVMLWHTFTRLSFITIPVLAITQAQPQLASLSFPIFAGGPLEWTGKAITLLPIGIYLAFLLISLPWISHQMEHEADIFACQNQSSSGAEPDSDYTNDLRNALLRLAALGRGYYEKQTLLHPSLKQRIELIEKIESSPNKINQFKRSFSRRRNFVLISFAVIWVSLTLL